MASTFASSIGICLQPFLAVGLVLFVETASSPMTGAAVVSVRAVATEKDGVIGIEYRSGETLVGRSTEFAPAGVEVRFPGGQAAPVQFRNKSERDGAIELGPVKVGALTLRWRIAQKNPSLVERTMEVTASEPQKISLTFPLDLAIDGTYESFSDEEKACIVYNTLGGKPYHPDIRGQTFPLAMLRAADRVFGLIADGPGLWENRCQILLDPQKRRLAIYPGDGCDPYSLGERNQNYMMDGWQSLAAGETKRFTTWVFASPARSHYDAQLAAHLALANGKGWNTSAVDAVLRNTSLFLLRRNFLRPPQDGHYIFHSGIGYGWIQWVSDGFYAALGLDDPEKTFEAYRSVYLGRITYEDNAQYYLIWSVLVKRAGGMCNEELVRKAYDFIHDNEKDGYFVHPPTPEGTFKTYHDLISYADEDTPASNQGFHCGALMAARELGLPVAEADIERAIAAYQKIFNTKRGFMPASRLKQDVLAQDSLYGATLTFAVFGRKILTDDQVLSHYRASEQVKTPYGLRVFSQPDGSLLPDNSGDYQFGGSWFLNDAANYLLAGVHGLPAAEVDARLIERICVEFRYVPAFNEDINTLTGKPSGHILYSWNSGYWWLRKEIRRHLGQTGPDPVCTAIDSQLGVVRENGALRLDPDKIVTHGTVVGSAATAEPPCGSPPLLIGYTEYSTNLPGGRPANVMSRRACVIRADGAGRRELAQPLTAEPNRWSEVVGWSPDGRQVIVQTGWQSDENAAWERTHHDKRLGEGYVVDDCLVDIVTGETRNLTAVDRVAYYNSSLFFWPNDPTKLGFVAVLGPGQEKVYKMNLDGTNKQDASQEACGFSTSSDGKRIAYEKGYQLYLADADGSHANKVETGKPFNHLPLWSPDGEWVVFLVGEIHNCHPCIVKSDGTGLRKLGDRNGYEGWAPDYDIEDYRKSSDDFPCWSQDSQWVYYTARVGEAVELLRVSLDGKTEPLTHSPAGTLTYDPKASPDGKWIAFGSTRDGARQLYVARPDGSGVRQLTHMKPGRAAKYFYWQTIPIAMIGSPAEIPPQSPAKAVPPKSSPEGR